MKGTDKFGQMLNYKRTHLATGDQIKGQEVQEATQKQVSYIIKV